MKRVKDCYSFDYDGMAVEVGFTIWTFAGSIAKILMSTCLPPCREHRDIKQRRVRQRKCQKQSSACAFWNFLTFLSLTMQIWDNKLPVSSFIDISTHILDF